MKLPKQIRKPTRKTLIKELDKLASQVVRSKGKCEICGKREGIQCAHIFSRRNLNTRWDLDNLMCLCYRCHIHFAHKEPMLFAEAVKEKLGEDKYKKLRQRAEMSGKGLDLAAIKLALEQKYKRLNHL